VFDGRSVDLRDRYRHLGYPTAVGCDCPALIEPWALTGLDGHLQIIDQPARLDRQLAHTRDRMVAELQAQGKHLFNGPVLALDHTIPGLLTCRPGSYFDMLAAPGILEREWAADSAVTPVRDRLDRLAGGDPLRHGQGRCAAIAVAALLMFGEGPDRRFVMGRRSQRLAVAPGQWCPIPAGMVEPADRLPLRDALAREISEELSHPALADSARIAEALNHAQIMGLSFDLLRLRLDVCVAVPVPDQEGAVPIGDPSEFDDVRTWDLSADGLAAAAEYCGAAGMTPAGGGALELAGWHLGSLRDRWRDLPRMSR
jgi:8-oxo-dGTP pyrophosphatase MutT (NUDIX family)